MDCLPLFPEDDATGEALKCTYVDIVLPLPLPKLTYRVPVYLINEVKVGIRVEVPLAKHGSYSGVVRRVHQEPPEANLNLRAIIAILDKQPIVTECQLKLWEWLADYYVAALGEVMNAAMPVDLKLSSETKIVLGPAFDPEYFLHDPYLTYKDTFVLETLQRTNKLTVKDLPKLLKQKTVYPIVKKLLERELICTRDELKIQYKPKQVVKVRLAEPYYSNPTQLEDALKLIRSSAQKQRKALLTLIQISKQKKEIPRKEICDKAGVPTSVIKKLSEKGILAIYSTQVSRLIRYGKEVIDRAHLSNTQQRTLNEIYAGFKVYDTILLHAVEDTSKIQIFVELMDEITKSGKQVLYLLPEIALTTRVVGRLQKYFGDKVVVYHSEFKDKERVEIWKSALAGTPIIMGTRSALFLPFQNLGLVIMDEEHDASYKQTKATPRYHARDTALYLAHLYNAKTLLSTATPSLESYKNVKEKKYGLVKMTKGLGDEASPKISIINLAKSKYKGLNKNPVFTPILLQALQRTLNNGEQAILFQNRRGYAPVYRCNTCGWTTDCTHCDVSMTYHESSNDLHCHYCGNKQQLPKCCKACGSARLVVQGFGTEKAEEELKIYFPDVRVMRMDWDSVKGRNARNEIIKSFKNKEVEVLVGTQMVTKDLDFDNVGLVGILRADQMFNFPDFRATERAYQLMAQVVDRASCKKKPGSVYIQAFNVKHPLLKEIKENNFRAFLDREMRERYDFLYPPFHRLIKIQFKHKNPKIVTRASRFFAQRLRTELNEAILGPTPPSVARVQNYYLMDIMIKLTPDTSRLKYAKNWISKLQNQLKKTKGCGTVRVVVDVDPY